MRAVDCAETYGDGRHYDSLTQPFTADIAFYLDLATLHGDPILELGCGTGRVAIPLARAGFDVTGIDVSEPMLRHAHRRCAQEPRAPHLVRADCRAFCLRRRFRLVLFPFNAIAHLHDREDFEACFAAVRRHLARDSRFVVDHFNPDFAILARDPSARVLVGEYDDPDGAGRVTITEHNVYDRASQVNRIVWHYAIAGIDVRAVPLTMRILFPQELDALLWYNGFAIEAKYGDYARTPFESSSRRQVIIASLRPGFPC